MDRGTPGSGARLRAMVTLMLVSLGVMLAAIFTLYFTPLGVAPLVAASLYAGLWRTSDASAWRLRSPGS